MTTLQDTGEKDAGIGVAGRRIGRIPKANGLIKTFGILENIRAIIVRRSITAVIARLQTGFQSFGGAIFQAIVGSLGHLHGDRRIRIICSSSVIAAHQGLPVRAFGGRVIIATGGHKGQFQGALIGGNIVSNGRRFLGWQVVGHFQ